LVQLQFQDRVGQILQHVIGSMEQVERTPVDLSGGNAAAQVRAQMESMARTYTTDEQRQLHRGLEAQAAKPQEVTFF
jgi:methyl-accepting chemotaxis protein